MSKFTTPIIEDNKVKNVIGYSTPQYGENNIVVVHKYFVDEELLAQSERENKCTSMFQYHSMINNIVGRVLTILDASIEDQKRLEALKTLVLQAIWSNENLITEIYKSVDKPEIFKVK
jgi:hypothetical protein